MQSTFKKPYDLNLPPGRQGHGPALNAAVVSLVRVLEEEILVPLVLPDEKLARIRGALEAVVLRIGEVNRDIEDLRSSVLGIAKDLYGEEAVRGY